MRDRPLSRKTDSFGHFGSNGVQKKNKKNKKNKEDARPDMHRHDKNNRTPMHQARQRRE
jgi:hypothetical protein